MSSIRRVAVGFAVFAFLLSSAFDSFAETINYTYDDMLRLVKAQYGDGTSVDYVYDNLGNRLIKTTTLAGAPANNPPNSITNPLPADSATEISATPTLTWQGGDPDAGDTVVYSVYFGTSPTPPPVSSSTDTTYEPGQLRSLTTYYWKVVAKDNHNLTSEGPLWSFTTTYALPMASFTSTTTRGLVPLNITYSDLPQPSDDEIASWAWDFNGDGIVDSTAQNPTYTYLSTGSFPVSLTVTDIHGATATVTKSDYITVFDNYPVDEGSVVHCVTSSSELQAALDDAASNGKDDLIQLVQGTYGISENNNHGFYYESSEPYKLFIKGGYAPGCSARNLNPKNTIIDGEGIGLSGMDELLRLSDVGDDDKLSANVALVIEGLTIKNSNSINGTPVDIYSFYGNILLINNIIEENYSEYGYNIYVDSSAGVANLNNNIIIHNVANDSTLGLWSDNGNIGVFNNYFGENTCNNENTININAGSDDISYVLLTNNTIVKNNTGDFTAFLQLWSGKISIVNNLVAQNVSSGISGGMFLNISYGKADVTNNTITGNSADLNFSFVAGLEIDLYNDSEANLYNNIILGNNSSYGNDILLGTYSGTSVNAFSNDFNPAKVEGSFTNEGNNLNVDPLFVDTEAGVFRLQATSPLRDAGDNAAPALPPTDILGNPRIIGTAPDLGAYERGQDFDDDGLTDAIDPDDDNDGMPDVWETTYGLNPLNAEDANLDSDGDGLTNLQEYLVGTNPANADSDGDGVTDGQDPYPTEAPTLTLSTNSLLSDESAEVALTVSYLNAPSIVIEQVVDVDQNGTADAGEPVIRSFTVTDGTASINPNIQRDEDGAINGTIATTLNFYDVLDRYHAPGDYVFRAVVGSNTAETSFTINPVGQTQTISGTVTDGTDPVAGVFVKLVDRWQRPVAYAVTDSLGQYLLNVKNAGEYHLVPEAFGYSATKSLFPFVELSSGEQLTGADLVVSRSGFSVSGQVYDNLSAGSIRGVMVTAESAENLCLALTEATGNYQLILPAGEYRLNVAMADGASPAFKGYVDASGQALTVNISDDLLGLNLPLETATILVGGALLDEAGLPVTQLPVQASAGQATETLAFATTSADGNFSLGLSQGTNWFISLEDSAAQSLGYIGNVLRDFSTSSGTLTGNDIVAHTVDAWIDGTVRDSSNTPLSGVPVIVRDETDSIAASVKTADDGTYRLGVFSGNWYVRAATEVLGYLPTEERSLIVNTGQTETADFVALTGSPGSYTIHAASTGNGTLLPAGDTVVASGASQAYSFSPDPGYRVGSVLIDGVTTSTDGSSYAFDNVTTDHTIEVNFDLDTFIVTAIVFGNGSINPAGVTTVPSGGSQEYTFIPDAGYRIEDVKIEGISIGAPSSYTLSNVQSDQSVEATFAPLTQTGTSLFGDDFNRADSATVGNGWVEVETSGASVDVNGGRLNFTETSDKTNRPMVSHSFAKVSSGKVVWEFDFDWTRIGDEGTYRLFMQLGDGALMTTASQDAGVGVNLIWTQIGGTQERLGYRRGGTNTALASVSGPTRITLKADLDTHTCTLAIDGVAVASGIPFDQNVALDTVRFFADGVSNNNFSGRSFDNLDIHLLDGPNTPPFAGNDSYSMNGNTALNVAVPGVLANDIDAEGNPLTSTLVSGPANGVLTLNADGSFSYAPDGNFTGTDSFTYKTSDGAADSNIATVTLTSASDLLSDDFNRADNATLGNGWDEVEATGASVEVSADRLTFSHTADQINRPMAVHSFAKVTSGKIVWEFDFDWTRTDDEAAYRLFMQLGDGALMTTANQDAGVGVNLIWTQIGGTEERLGYRRGGNATALATVSGPTRITVVADLDTHTFGVAIDGAAVASGLPFDQNVPLDTVRFFADEVSDVYFSGRSFDTLDIHRMSGPNTPPVAGNDSYSMNGIAALSIAAPGVLANDIDAEGNSLTAALVSGPANGVLTLNADGSFSYTPGGNFTGTDSFTYKTNDGMADSNIATVTLTSASDLLSDDFNRADSTTVGNGWVEVEAAGASVDVSADRLTFSHTADQINRPMAVHRFAKVTSGKIVWEFDFDWTRTGNEGIYRLFMQLGDGALMTTASQDTGVGVNLIWTKISATEERLGYRRNGSTTALATVSGLTWITVEADLETHTYTVAINGAAVASGLYFDKNVALDTVRFFADEVSDLNFSGRAFDSVVIRR
jgi:PKD repeat protein